jgi:hypothetical protein
MISDPVLAHAIDRGLITAAQAEGLRALARAEAEAPLAAPPPLPTANTSPPLPSRDEAVEPDDEKLRFITGFADIFVTLGIALFFGAAGYLIGLYVGNALRWAALAALAWLLAEFFTRRHRMALPSIFLLALFSISVFNATLAFSTPAAGSLMSWLAPGGTLNWFSMYAPGMLAAALVTAALAALHYWRFHVPITIAAGAAALCAAFIAAAYWLLPQMDVNVTNGLLLVCGLGVFAFAMRFDISDPTRQTRRTDIAFWLHLLAAPLIVHPFIAKFVHGGAIDTTSALVILGIFLGFGIVSVIIDRRALLVSGLAYAGLALGTLVRETTFANITVPATLLALGFFILLLSAGWRPLRNAILHLLPAALALHLPRPRPS